MLAANRKAVLSRLLATSEQRLADEVRLDREICKTLRHLVDLLVRRYLNWTGRYLSIGEKCTDYQLSVDEIRALIRARVASRSEFSHKLFFAVVRDSLRKAPEDAQYVLTGLFTVHDDLPPPEPLQRPITPLIELLKRLLANEN